MKAVLRHTGNLALLAKSDSNHWLVFDAGAATGGTNAASSPFESLIMAAGGCVSMDVVYILTKSRKAFSRFELEVEATRAETHPKRVTSLLFHARMDGEALTAHDVEKALTLSLSKYCAVTLSLDRSVELRATFTLNGVTGPEWFVPRNPEIYAP